MPPNRLHLAALVLAAGGLATFASSSALLLGCSSDMPPGPDVGTSSGSTEPSSGSSSGPTATTTGTASGSSGSSGASGADPIAACISACEAKHPSGAQIGAGIDKCWSQSCPTQCNGIGAGAAKPAAHGTCRNAVSTPSAECSQCTVDRCCAAWDACFDNADCTALNACSIACYK